MFTRKQYLDKECTHREYYAQFVTQHTRNLVTRAFGTEALVASFKANDLHSADYIQLDRWDSLSMRLHVDQQFMRDCGDYLTLAGAVCILKEAARQVVESSNL